MKHIANWLCVILFSLSVSADQPLNEGIKFEKASSWKAVLDKAKKENKYIFVDAYTTWCVPCKKLAKEVFPQPKVGAFFNQQFVSVQVQMDSSTRDSEAIKGWYADAKGINNTYKVTAYPTMLILTAEGKLLDRVVGFVEASELLAKAANIISPEKNYYALLEAYDKGTRDLKAMSFLARQALVLKDTATSDKIAKEYLKRVKKEDLLTKENIEFSRQFTKSTTEPGFTFFYRNAGRINDIMQSPGYAEGFAAPLIYREIVVPAEERAKATNTTPDWSKLTTQITKKYNGYYADRLVTSSRAFWAKRHKNYAEYTHYFVPLVEKYATPRPGSQLEDLIWNNQAWEVFLYSDDIKELETALTWSAKAIIVAPDPNSMDTHASILYKLGRKKEALMWQRTAIKLNPEDVKLKEKLEAMEKDQPIWPDHKN